MFQRELIAERLISAVDLEGEGVAGGLSALLIRYRDSYLVEPLLHGRARQRQGAVQCRIDAAHTAALRTDVHRGPLAVNGHTAFVKGHPVFLGRGLSRPDKGALHLHIAVLVDRNGGGGACDRIIAPLALQGRFKGAHQPHMKRIWIAGGSIRRHGFQMVAAAGDVDLQAEHLPAGAGDLEHVAGTDGLVHRAEVNGGGSAVQIVRGVVQCNTDGGLLQHHRALGPYALDLSDPIHGQIPARQGEFQISAHRLLHGKGKRRLRLRRRCGGLAGKGDLRGRSGLRDDARPGGGGGIRGGILLRDNVRLRGGGHRHGLGPGIPAPAQGPRSRWPGPRMGRVRPPGPSAFPMRSCTGVTIS